MIKIQIKFQKKDEILFRFLIYRILNDFNLFNIL